MFGLNQFKNILNNQKNIPRLSTSQIKFKSIFNYSTINNKISFEEIKFKTINGNTIVLLPKAQVSSNSSITVFLISCFLFLLGLH